MVINYWSPFSFCIHNLACSSFLLAVCYTLIPLDFPEQYHFKFGPEAHETLLFYFCTLTNFQVNDHGFLKMLHAVHNLMACLLEGNLRFANGSWTYKHTLNRHMYVLCGMVYICYQLTIELLNLTWFKLSNAVQRLQVIDIQKGMCTE